MALADNLIAYYKFNNGRVTADSVGHKNLTNSGTVASTSSGLIGYGADFGATNTTKSLGRSNPFASYPLSVSGWFRADIANDNGNIWSLGDDTTHYYQLKLRNTDSHLVFRSNNASDAGDIDTGITVSTGTWYHVAVTIHSTTSVSIWVNGTATNTTATIYVASSLVTFRIGALARSSPLQYFSGKQDEIYLFDRALVTADVTSLYNGGAGLEDAYELKTSLKAYWKMDESSGDAMDSIASHTLTNSNVTFSTGKINNGAVFNSTTDKLETATITDFDFAQFEAFSFSFWVNHSSLASNPIWIAHLNASANYQGYELKVDSAGKITFYIGSDNGGGSLIFVTTANGAITTGSFQHVVVTYDGSGVASGMHIWVDGVDKTLTTVFDNLSANPTWSGVFTIGNRAGSAVNLTGTVDEVGVWHRALKSTEVSLLRNGGSGSQYPFATDVTVSQGTPPNATFTIPAYTTTAIRNATISGTVLTATFSIPTRTITTAVTVAPTVQTATFSIPVPNVYLNDVSVSVSLQTATFSIPSATITATQTVDVSATVVSATFSIPTYTPVGGADISVSPSVQSATFSIPVYTENISVSVSVAVQTMTFSTPSETVTGELNALCTPSAQVLTVTIPAYTTTGVQHVTISPDTMLLVATIPTFAIVADFWQNKFSDAQTSWSDKY